MNPNVKTIPGFEIFWMAMKQINPIEKSKKMSTKSGEKVTTAKKTVSGWTE